MVDQCPSTNLYESPYRREIGSGHTPACAALRILLKLAELRGSPGYALSVLQTEAPEALEVAARCSGQCTASSSPPGTPSTDPAEKPHKMTMPDGTYVHDLAPDCRSWGCQPIRDADDQLPYNPIAAALCRKFHPETMHYHSERQMKMRRSSLGIVHKESYLCRILDCEPA